MKPAPVVWPPDHFDPMAEADVRAFFGVIPNMEIHGQWYSKERFTRVACGRPPEVNRGLVPCLRGEGREYIPKKGDPPTWDAYQWTPALMTEYLRLREQLRAHGMTGYKPNLLDGYKLQPQWKGPGARY